MFCSVLILNGKVQTHTETKQQQQQFIRTKSARSQKEGIKNEALHVSNIVNSY